MKRFLDSIVDIRRGEIALTALMFSNYYLILVTYYFLKPARDSLFLVKVSPQMLPVVFIITALVAVPITTLYSKASRFLKLNQLIHSTTLVIILNLIILRWLIDYNQPWVYYLFYTWVSIFGALTTSQFWLLANSVYDASQAKRVFAVLGLGGILGAFSGGEITSLVISKFGVSTEDLLLYCVALLLVCMGMVWLIWRMKGSEISQTIRKSRKSEPPPEKMTEIFKSIFKSRHLTLTVGIVAMTMMVASFIDFQFKTVSYEAFPTKEALTAFLGKFYGRLSLVSLLLQLVLAYRVIRWIGVGGVILFLPIALALGSAAMFIAPGLIAAVILRGGDGSLKYSLDKTARELLFLPVPLELKKRTKIFIDMFIDRWFRGIAGGLLLLCTLVLELSVKQISIVVIVFVMIWLVFSLMMRKEYVNSFRKALERREIDPEEIRVHINDEATVNSLIVLLASENERHVVYALEMLISVTDVELIWPVKPLLHHRSAEVRRKALVLLQDHGNESIVDEVRGMLVDEDTGIRREAIRFLLSRSDNSADRLESLLTHENNSIRNAAVGHIAMYGNAEEHRLLNATVIDAVMRDDSPTAEEGRRELAGAVGSVDLPGRQELLDKLLADQSHRVVCEAIASVGRIKDRRHLPWLLAKLGDNRLRAEVRAALVSFGPGILGTLEDYMADGSVGFLTRSAIPRVLSLIPQQRSVEILTAAIGTVESSMKHHVIRALNGLRNNSPELKFDFGQLEKLVIQETKTYYEILHLLRAHSDSEEDPACKLLTRALSEKRQKNLEWIFRLLGLVYPPRDIYNAYLGLVSGNRTLHANALEFLDNLLGQGVKRYLFPILDDLSIDSILSKAGNLFDFQMTDRNEALICLMNGQDAWLRACAIFVITEEESEQVKQLARQATKDSDPIIAETATLVVNRLQRIE